MIQKLDKTIIGKGSVKGIVYNQVYENEAAYIYATDDYFEVFKKEITPICINFEKRIYSETDFKEVYPFTAPRPFRVESSF